MPFDVSSMDDNASCVSTISSIFDGDLTAEIEYLRTYCRTLFADAKRLQEEYRRYLDMSTDLQAEHRHEFDAFKGDWIASLRRYIDSARTMYAAERITMPHYRAVALSVDCLVTAWNATPLLTKSASTRYFPPSVADILELDTNGCSATPTHEDMLSTAAHSSPTPPSGPSSGPNIVEWLENSEKSSFSCTKIARESAVEAEVEAETSAKMPETFPPTNESSAHIPSSDTSMYALFVDLRREMERLDRENEQLRQQVADAVATAAAAIAARLDVEKEEESRIKSAIQRAEKAEKEKDELVDGFIRVCIQHSASDRQFTENPSHECSSKINLRKKNLLDWLSSFPTEETRATTL